MRAVWTLFKNALADFVEDDAMTLGAALAFYTALAMAPLLLCLVAIAGLAGAEFEREFTANVAAVVGAKAAEAVNMIMDSADSRPDLRSLSGFLGIITLLVGASGTFAQLQYAMNRIWDVQARPGQGIWGWIRKRFLSAGMVIAVGFVLLVSLALSAALSGAGRPAHDVLPGADALWGLVDIVISFATVVALFAVIYKVLPDVRIAWRDVWFGAGVTAALFAAGKFAIGVYLGRSSVASAYGAAGSLILLLLWVYYSSLIVFFGAELTQEYAKRRGAGIEPDEHAVRIMPRKPVELPGPAAHRAEHSA
jgi:membrane protein